MSRAIVIVGPWALRGPHPVAEDLVIVALASIDDALALVDERVVAVDQVWRDVFRAALAGRCDDDVTLVVPSWWAGSRVARVTAAARVCAANVAVRQRITAWPAEATVVEVAAEMVIVHTDTQRNAIARLGAPAAVIEAVGACVEGSIAVTVDVPAGSGLFGAELVHGLRRTGTTVAAVDDRMLESALAAHGEHTAPRRRHRVSPRVAVLVGAALTVTTLGAAAGLLDGGPKPAAESGRWLIEGRVAVEIPADWTVERITSGPGSARVQIHSPTAPLEAIQVTQSQVPDAQTLGATAETLRLALADEPDGVFVDFTAAGHRAERAAVTYRELRADHHVAWSVLLDRGVRIAIGCQGTPDGTAPEQACDRAIRSARAVP